ncbi:class I SAM-dependent RNA methyltransferase [Fulvivirga sp. M361]|uniref:THUMP domain-containing class I SAM-dependent RNA methyltransferase n=1 Tax=Fulvivirga sp. M361 TaxID=2594266 RepID=UPI00117A1BCD|nr:THUMP domain-containing protein [Fulvivirga sp. M361]TRX55988.1 class I SAM-dependent RNA methyltransferase [Fulvivirga sp. M361]
MSKIIISCAPRISPYVHNEVLELGYKSRVINQLGIEIEGSLQDAMRLNLHLRAASKVLMEIKSFRAANADELYATLVEIAWERIIPQRGYIRIEGFVRNDTIRDTRYANVKVKDAIVDRIQKIKGERPNSGPESNRTVIFLHWKGDQATIYVNTSGEPISKHGYRKFPHKAPMQESLAAAALLASKWDCHSHFINPMCGSGTLAIEAALLACNISPGLFRENYGFMHLRYFNELEWKKLYKEAQRKVKKELDFKIIATDISPKAIDAARKNAANAGVDHLIEFSICDFKETFIPKSQPGVVFFNPEYGERLGDENKLAPVYTEMGDFFKQKCQGYWGYIFSGNLELLKNVGLKTKRRIEFHNARIDARLLEYELYGGSKKHH